jgi:hypothetical protein
MQLLLQHVVLLLLALSKESNGQAFDNLYYSWVDATCIDDYTIDGSSLMQFEYIDTEYVSSLQIKEVSNCYYLKEGYVSHDTFFGYDRDDDDDNAMHEWDGYGYCMTCDGITGCSSDGTCENFKSQAAPYYENSHTSYGNGVLANSNSNSNSSGTNNNSDDDDRITLEMLLAKVPSEKFQEMLQQSNADMESSRRDGDYNNAFLMPLMVVAGILVAGLVAGLVFAISKRKKKIGNRDLSAAMLSDGQQAPMSTTIGPQIQIGNIQRPHALV